MVPGLRIAGDLVEHCEITLDSDFKTLPIPALLGIPLAYKPYQAAADREVTSAIAGASGRTQILRLLANPASGVACVEGSVATSMLLAREDDLPFSRPDCEALCAYLEQWATMVAEWQEMSAEWKEMSTRFLTQERFRKYLTQHIKQQSDQYPDAIAAFLSIQFPLGCIVKASGLSKLELNGLEGCVVKYARDRVGIKFVHGICALKPERLSIVRLKSCETSSDDDEVHRDSAPEAKGNRGQAGEALHSTVTEGDMVQNDMKVAKDPSGAAERQSRHLAQSFVESLLSNSMALNDEREFWGFAKVGEDHHSLNDHVLRAWVGLLSHELVSEDILAKALARGRVQELFKSLCRRVAQDGFSEQHIGKSSSKRSNVLGRRLEETLNSIERLSFTDFQHLEWDTLE